MIDNSVISIQLPWQVPQGGGRYEHLFAYTADFTKCQFFIVLISTITAYIRGIIVLISTIIRFRPLNSRSIIRLLGRRIHVMFGKQEIMLSKKKSKKFALDIAEEFNGKIEDIYTSFDAFATCYYCVKFKYKNMRVETYPFYPFCQIWIQNFRFPHDISFSIGIDLPTLGLTLPLNNLFKDYSVPVFSNDAYNIEVIKAFSQVLKNEIDIKNIKMDRKEYLIISSGQIVMHNKNRDLNSIVERINILSNLFERNNKT